ncbi:MAG: Glycosyl transferase group 1 [Parcubacteria group bacterium GW2011_GWA2_56_21]|nr:MAG: Glycosyl transferase group 1 [Parcubacteria group bacterium GW2011_GWA2_56_21]
MNTKAPRIVFIFTNAKDNVIRDVQAENDADTPLHGMNHFAGVEYMTIHPQSIRAALFIPRLLRYDFIIAQDNFLLGFIVSHYARLCRLKTRWLYVAIHSSTLMRRHAAHPIRLFLLKHFWASYARIICISSLQLEDFVRLGIPREHLVCIPFGVDAPFFQRAGVSREEDLIVSVGRDAGRDYGTLFKAAEQVGYPFVVVAGHKNISPDMPVPAHVSVQYDRPLAEVRDLYEAVIATRRAWMTDYFVPDQDLRVVEPNDPKALAHAIALLWQDAQKRERLAASGHAKVVERYTTKMFAEALRRLMDSLV